MNNLAQFKKRVSENVNQEINLVNHLHPDRTRKTKIIHSQSNSFAIQTQNEAKKDSKNIYDHSWIEFGKATNWQFENNIATALTNDKQKAFSIQF